MVFLYFSPIVMTIENLLAGNCAISLTESVSDDVYLGEREILAKGCKTDVLNEITDRVTVTVDKNAKLRLHFAAFDIAVEGMCANSFVNVQTSNAYIMLLSKSNVVCVSRCNGDIASIIDYSGQPPLLHDDKLIFVAPSSTRMIPYGGSESPAALDVTIRGASDGSLLSSYEVLFTRVSYFTTTLHMHVQDSGAGSMLLLSCWDDMCVKMIDLTSGVLTATLQQSDEHTATVKCIASNEHYISIGFEWQRYIKLPPLCIYNIEGTRLHEVGSGASPKQLQIHNNVLFSIVENAKEIRVWCLESGNRLYSIPADNKIAWFRFREDRMYIATNQSGTIYNANITAARPLIDITVWDFRGSVENLREAATEENKLVLIGGKKVAAKRKKKT